MTTPDIDRIAEAQQIWLIENISKLTDRFFDLGKFLFGISSGSIGIVVAISKIPTPAHIWTWIEWTAVSLFLLSGAMGGRLVLPSDIEIGGNSSVQTEYEKYADRNSRLTKFWAVAWGAGVLFAGYGLVD